MLILGFYKLCLKYCENEKYFSDLNFENPEKIKKNLNLHIKITHM